jgi:hypothetical protein
MKLFLSASVSLVFLFLSAHPCFSAEDIGITGTWEGTIYLSELDIDMEIVLVLAEKSGTVTGHISDDWGYLDCDITDPALEQNILTFKAMVETSQNDHQMVFRMMIAGDKMTGQWESLGSFGDWSLVKKKEGEKKNREKFQIEDIAGVWEGPAAYKRNPGSKNVLTLMLEEKEGKLFATFADQFKTSYERVNIKSFQGNNLFLEIIFSFKNENYVMDMDIDIKDDSHMRGKFKIEKIGRTGIWTAEKKPNK